MWPGSPLPQYGNTVWNVFYASDDWSTYAKPPNASMIYILMIGAGGGGNRPPDGVTGTSGGGGGSGGMSKLLIPAALMPDILYVRVGKGGVGATVANTIGTNGGTSYISVAPSTSGVNVLAVQNGGSAGASVSSGGNAGNTSPGNANVFANLIISNRYIGQIGGPGTITTNGNGTSISAGANGIITTSGAGGANGSGTPGAINGGGVYPTLTTNAVSGGARAGFLENSPIGPGLKSFPLFFSGGSGGFGRTTAGNCGAGGDGSYGGGGGGGGSGTNAGSFSGNGGNGGDGLIIIGTF